jgi:uncharacterized protein YbjT (DUF2867 family)/uncharacterized membrane protein YphA (DoxX/SURF4 family)
MVVGATGFIGARLVDAFAAAGHDVRCASRNSADRRGCDSSLRLDYTSLPTLGQLTQMVAGCEVVINAVGILRERGRQTFEALHAAGPQALFRACALAGVRRVIQISALGADGAAVSDYHRSKHAADRALMDQPLDWAVVQPSLVYGAGGTSAALFDALASLPVLPLPGDGRQLVQPVHIDDLVAAVLRLAESPATLHCVLPVVGPQSMTLREFLGALRLLLGHRPTLPIPVPLPLVRLGARLATVLPGSLLDAETLAMLERGNTGDPSTLTSLLGRKPRPVREFIAPGEHALQGTTAALRWLLPLLRISVAVMWFIAAIVSMGPHPTEQSIALLTGIGIPAALADEVLMVAIGVNLTLGILTLLPRRPRWLWSAQILTVLGYTAIISWRLPELWLEPFGPVAKNIPILVLLLLLRQLERRS